MGIQDLGDLLMLSLDDNHSDRANHSDLKG